MYLGMLLTTAGGHTPNTDVVEQLAVSAGILFVGWIAQRITRRVIKRTISGLQGDVVQRRLGTIRRRTPRALLNTGENLSLRRVQRAETIGSILRSGSTLVIFVITAFAILRQFQAQANLAPFVAGTGIATAALLFGAQNIVRDFLAGFFIVVEDQYGVGDIIDVGTTSGTVEFVSLRITRVRSANGTLWHVPNGEIKKVGNMSQRWARSIVDFNVNLNTHIPTAIKLIKREADDLWRDSAFAGIIIDEPEIWAPESIDGDGIKLSLAVKVRPLEQWQVSRTLRSRIKAAFDEHGIRIASTLSDPYGKPAASSESSDDNAKTDEK